MTGLDCAVQLAREELAARSFAITQQYLAVHEVATDSDGTFAVARLDDTSQPGSYHVYFALRDEEYHIVVAVRPDARGELQVSWVYLQPFVRVYLVIESQDVKPSEVTSRVSLTPTSAHERGQPTDWKSLKTHRAHVWELEPQAGVPGGFNEKLAVLLERIKPAALQVAALRPECVVVLEVLYIAWRGDPQFGGLHLDPEAVRQISALGAAVDVDLYASGPLMAEDPSDADTVT